MKINRMAGSGHRWVTALKVFGNSWVTKCGNCKQEAGKSSDKCSKEVIL